MPTDYEQECLIRAIYATPKDDAPRLAYADWLDEHRDDDGYNEIRAALIRDMIRGHRTFRSGSLGRKAGKLIDQLMPKLLARMWHGNPHANPKSIWFKRNGRKLIATLPRTVQSERSFRAIFRFDRGFAWVAIPWPQYVVHVGERLALTEPGHPIHCRWWGWPLRWLDERHRNTGLPDHHYERPPTRRRRLADLAPRSEVLPEGRWFGLLLWKQELGDCLFEALPDTDHIEGLNPSLVRGYLRRRRETPQRMMHRLADGPLRATLNKHSIDKI